MKSITYPCQGSGCRATLEIDTPHARDEDEAEAHASEIAEISHGWLLGIFCPDCRERSSAEREADGLTT